MLSFQQPDGSTTRRTSSKWVAVCLLLLLAAGAEFLFRGPVRAIHVATQFNDFLSPYIQAQAWMRGLDPYSPETLLRLWPVDAAHYGSLAREVADGSVLAKRGIPTAYPLTSLVLLAPISVLPWKLAYGVWLTANLVFFSIMLYVLLGLTGFSYREPTGILLVAMTLALAPFHTGIVTGNIAVVAVELGVIAVWATRGRHEIWAAVLLALSIGLKPQIGLCFFLYYLARRRWRVFGIALVVLILITALGLLRLELSHTVWVRNYLNDNRALLETGILANFTPVNPTRFGLINLQVVLYSLVGSISLANDWAVALGATLLIVWAVGVRRERLKDDLELLDLSAIAVVSLLPVYHRFYDAALLVLPLCWVFLSFRRSRLLGAVSLLLILPFLIPGGTLLEAMQAGGHVPSALVNRWWWETIVLPHQVWMLFSLSVLLLYEMNVCRWSRSSSGRHAAGSPAPPSLEKPV